MVNLCSHCSLCLLCSSHLFGSVTSNPGVPESPWGELRASALCAHLLAYYILTYLLMCLSPHETVSFLKAKRIFIPFESSSLWYIVVSQCLLSKIHVHCGLEEFLEQHSAILQMVKIRKVGIIPNLHSVRNCRMIHS